MTVEHSHRKGSSYTLVFSSSSLHPPPPHLHHSQAIFEAIQYFGSPAQQSGLINPPLALICFKGTARLEVIAIPQVQHQGVIKAHHSTDHFSKAEL